ncbi:cache domain-containing protein [Massilia sp. W12]|uniref:cache domain-containing protein n=1 Tax=Massilia sp. W12 TaxID=3126507 RepID=UPI0030D3770F
MSRSIFSQLLLALLFSGTQAQAASNEADARKMLEKAVEYYQQHGYEKGLEECNRLDGPFNAKSEINQGDLYLFTLTYDGVSPCHGKNPKLRGKSMINLKDQNGVEFIKLMVEQCKAKGDGHVDYVWPHPETKALMKKRSFTIRIPGKEECLGAGISLPG